MGTVLLYDGFYGGESLPALQTATTPKYSLWGRLICAPGGIRTFVG
jgi:hypothetical protein